MILAGSLIDNKLLKLSDGKTLPLSAISLSDPGYEAPYSKFGFVLALAGIAMIAATAAWIGIIALVIGIILARIRKYFLEISLHSGKIIRLDMGKREMFQAHRQLDNALLGLSAEAVALPTQQTTANPTNLARLGSPTERAWSPDNRA